MVLIIGAVLGVGQIGFSFISPELSSFLAATLALLSLYPLSRWSRYSQEAPIEELPAMAADEAGSSGAEERSEEHTSELQSRRYLHSFPTRRSSDLWSSSSAPSSASDRSASPSSARSCPRSWRPRSPCSPSTRSPGGRATARRPRSRSCRPWPPMRPGPPAPRRDRKSTRLNSSHADIYTLSLHDALPIYGPHHRRRPRRRTDRLLLHQPGAVLVPGGHARPALPLPALPVVALQPGGPDRGAAGHGRR